MASLITIHGTNDGLLDVSATADETAEKWWSATSEFGVEAAAATGANIEPFQWSGSNDEMERRSAGKALYDHLARKDRDGEAYSVIGHSHGGSVLYHAMRHAAAKGNLLPNLDRIVSVGTPFLKFAQKPGIFERVNGFGRLSIVFIITTLLVTISLGLTQVISGGPTDGVAGKSAFLTNLEFLIIGAVMVGLLTWSLLRFRRLHSPKVEQQIAGMFSDRWECLAHDSDEAVNSLRQAPAIKPKLVDYNITRGLMQVVFAVLGITYIYGADLVGVFGQYVPEGTNALRGFADGVVGFTDALQWPAVRQTLENIAAVPGGWIDGIVKGFAEGRDGTIWDAIYGIQSTDTVLETIRILLFTGIFLSAETINRWTLGRPVAASLNGVVRNNLLAMAYGNSTVGEAPVATVDVPHGWSGLIEMPQEVTDRIQDHAVNHASNTLRAIQDALREAQETGGDLASVFSGSLTWNELIHTSYFRVAESRKWIVSLLGKRA